MNPEFYDYIRKLHLYVSEQDKKIRRLEKSLQLLSKEVTFLKERPPVNVERIEYKFDQLKVESLDGTLNIGLNPSDLQGVEDFSVQNQGLKVPYSPKEHMHRVMELEDRVFQYLEDDLEGIYNETLAKMNIIIDDSYLNFIKEDIKKQVPKRIEHYLRENVANNRSNADAIHVDQTIIEQIKKEIQNGVYAFINSLPDNVKGMRN